MLAGDWVVLDSVEDTHRTGRIIDIEPRQNELGRPKVANVDQVVIVHPLREPDFSYEQLDRYLTHTALAGLDAAICISKSDLGDDDQERDKIIGIYEQKLRLPLVFTSIHDMASFKIVRELVSGKTSVLAGVSGAGKSTLLNQLNPNLNLRVGKVSGKIGRGQHTTRHVELLEVLPQVDIADTPGFSNLKFDYVLPARIEAVYPDFKLFRDQCHFSDCLHLDEADCGVRPYVGNAIALSRYESYQAMILEALNYQEALQSSSQKQEQQYKTRHRKGRNKNMKILRIDEKDREASRKARNQQVSTLLEGYCDLDSIEEETLD